MRESLLLKCLRYASLRGTLDTATQMDLKTYCNNGGVGTAASLAREIGVSPVLISQWSGVRAVPPIRAVEIERATGGVVTRRDLRPDDWHLIWPELLSCVTKETA